MRLLVIVVVGAVLGATAYYMAPRLFPTTNPNPAASDLPQLKTGGTSAIFVVIENIWKSKYRDAKKVDVVCDSAGTTVGVQQMLDKVYTIAYTHAPVSAELCETARKKGLDIVQIPLFLCGVVPAYHLDGVKTVRDDKDKAVTDDKDDAGKEENKDEKEEEKKNDKLRVKFTGEVLADIFLGKITNWNDPALRKINPDLILPDKKIIVIHRKDSSGTTQLFTEFLAAASPAWVEKVGKPSAEVQWPVGEAASRNQGVAAKINDTDGALGYVDREFVEFQDIKLSSGAVQNKDKSAFVIANPQNLTAAATAILADIPEDLTFSLIDKPGKDSYPIAGVIYAVCADKQSETTRQQIVDFLHWATHDGQAFIAGTAFAPLPDKLAERIDHRLEAIKVGK